MSIGMDCSIMLLTMVTILPFAGRFAAFKAFNSVGFAIPDCENGRIAICAPLFERT